MRETMKQNTHPQYKEIVFLDMSTGKKFLCRSTVSTEETTDFEGKQYPCCKVSISSSSHPFYTGDNKFVDTEGRVDKFNKRYSAKPVAPLVLQDVAPAKEVKVKKVAEKKEPDAKKEAAPKKEAVAKKAPAQKKTAK